MGSFYSQIKNMQKKLKVSRINDLLALDPKNDPFYSGTKGDYEKGEWFAALWHQFGFASVVHLRRMHYRIVSQQNPIPLPSGELYLNTEGSWGYLCQAAKQARYLGLVSLNAFEDHRNPDPHETYKTEAAELDFELEETGELATALPDLPGLPAISVTQGLTAQPYHLEVWVEKSTMNDVLLPICRRYEANLVTAAGEFSITAVNHLMQRIEASGKPGRILYISDFDPAGVGMPRSVARKAEWFYYKTFSGLDVALNPVALTLEQTRRYNLPRTPIKDSEARKYQFEATYGDGATELDALEALHPGELRRIISQELDQFFDYTLDEQSRVARNEYQKRLEAAQETVNEQFADRWRQLQQQYQGLVDQIAPQFRQLATAFDEFQEEYSQSLAVALVQVEKPDLPEPTTSEGWEGPLYWSKRDYQSQIKVYKEFSNNKH